MRLGSAQTVMSCVGLALMIGLVGCAGQPDEPVSPTPSASVSVTPTPSPSPTPDMDALYAEAERVLRRSVELELRAAVGGGVDYPMELETLLAGPYLTESRVGIGAYQEFGWRAVEGATPILTVRPRPGMSMGGSEVTLEVCLDTRPSPKVDEAGKIVSYGVLKHKHYFFKHIDGTLKLFLDSKSVKVDQCPIT